MSDQERAEDFPVTDLYLAACNYAVSCGAENLGAIPGLWQRSIDDHWFIAVNPHTEELTTYGANNKGMKWPVPPFAIHVQYNGWAAGDLTPTGGWIAAGDGANETTFLAALRTATAQLTPTYSEDAGQ